MAASRKDALINFSVVAALLVCPLMALAQVTGTALPTDTPPMVPTTTVSGTIVIQAEGAATAPATIPAAMPEVPVATQPFVGTVTADKVYVRSGPGTAYYEMGHLAKGDLVQVVATRLGWYQILPPNGTFCMVAKEFVEADASGDVGTVKADYVNVRAGTALNKTRDPIAVLTVVRKGTRLKILGSMDKYYQIAPPEKAYVYVSPQFVKAAGAGVEYKVPDLKLPLGTTGPALNTVSAPTTLPTATVDISPVPAPVSGETPVAPAATKPAPAPVPAPAVTFSADAKKKFDELNTRYQAELQKPVGQRDLDGLISEYKLLLADKEAAPSVKMGAESRVAALEKLATIQRLQKESASSADALAEQRKALQEQYSAAEKAIEEYERTGPYLAEGVLQTSTTVQGKYALVNPASGRTVAYVDPASQIDIASLVGKYIGVRGTTRKAEGMDVTVIQVKNATLLPNPVPAKPAGR